MVELTKEKARILLANLAAEEEAGTITIKEECYRQALGMALAHMSQQPVTLPPKWNIPDHFTDHEKRVCQEVNNTIDECAACLTAAGLEFKHA